MPNPNQTASRRGFLRTTATATAWAASSSLITSLLLTRMAAQSPESRVDILLDESVGTIAPGI